VDSVIAAIDKWPKADENMARGVTMARLEAPTPLSSRAGSREAGRQGGRRGLTQARSSGPHPRRWAPTGAP